MSMTGNRIQPLIIGRGSAGRALAHALTMYPEAVAPPRFLERGAELPPPPDPHSALVVVAGPHALHTPRLVEADALGYRYAICEKPAAVDPAQVDALSKLEITTWICHGYRMLWGPQELRRALASGRFGSLVSIEGCYWQSSAAREERASSWKDDTSLAGRFDVLLDLATHWVDLVTFLIGNLPDRGSVRRWYVNAASPHRDTHVHVAMNFGDVASFGSVSKTVHGAGNDLEITIVGERASAQWTFERPDVLAWGSDGERSTQVRPAPDLPARPAPFHGLGWMEGYARIVEEVAGQIQDGRPARAPTLAEHLGVLRWLLDAAEHDKSSC